MWESLPGFGRQNEPFIAPHPERRGDRFAVTIAVGGDCDAQIVQLRRFRRLVMRAKIQDNDDASRSSAALIAQQIVGSGNLDLAVAAMGESRLALPKFDDPPVQA